MCLRSHESQNQDLNAGLGSGICFLTDSTCCFITGEFPEVRIRPWALRPHQSIENLENSTQTVKHGLCPSLKDARETIWGLQYPEMIIPAVPVPCPGFWGLICAFFAIRYLLLGEGAQSRPEVRPLAGRSSCRWYLPTYLPAPQFWVLPVTHGFSCSRLH